jgi:hypothetical protein
MLSCCRSELPTKLPSLLALDSHSRSRWLQALDCYPSPTLENEKERRRGKGKGSEVGLLNALVRVDGQEIQLAILETARSSTYTATSANRDFADRAWQTPQTPTDSHRLPQTPQPLTALYSYIIVLDSTAQLHYGVWQYSTVMLWHCTALWQHSTATL